MKYRYYIRKFWLLYIVTAIAVLAGSVAADQAITAMADNVPISRSHVIVIDPGHGGIDGGATSCSGVLESKFNLEIARTLDDLCHLLGYQTRMIRTSDISVYTEGNTIAAKKASDLRNRVSIVNNQDNAILISIHQNIFPDSRYSGAQVFYAPTIDSRQLADRLQNMLVSSLNPGSKRLAKEADGIYLMQHIRCPGVLIECGFLSNPEEEAKLRTQEYQRKLCCVMVSGLSGYINA